MIRSYQVSIQKEAIHLVHVVIKYHWIYAKRILLYFEKNDVKSTRKLIEPTMRLTIKSFAMDGDKMIVVMVIAELIQFATKSRSKIVKKNSWMYFGLLIQKQIKSTEELSSAGSSPSYAMSASNKKCTFGQSPQNMLDLLQSVIEYHHR